MIGDEKLSVPSTSRSVSPTAKFSVDLSDLKRQRGGLRGRLTQFKNYLDALDFNNTTPLQIKEIKFRMVAITDVYKNFNHVQNQIERISPQSEATNNFEYVTSFETLYFSILATAESLIESGVTGDCSTCLNSNGHVSRANVKLPDIKLPSFDGSFDQWLEYKNSYITMIHKRSDLDEIQKFHYLRSSLSGSALQVISALEFTASNYNHAWDLLQNRFHNTRLLVHNHLKSLFTIPSLKQESHVNIRKLIDTVLRNLRALQTLGEPTESWDTIIIYLIASKLDSATERDWESHKGSISSDSTRLKLDDLLAFLRNKADMLDMIHANQNKSLTERFKRTHDTNVNAHKQNSHHSHNSQVHSYVTATNKVTTGKSSNNNQNKRAGKCPSCHDNHALYTCYKFLNLSVEDRIKFVNDKQLCRNCLRAGHSMLDCQFGPCKQCSNKHNTLLHSNLLSNSRMQNEYSAGTPGASVPSTSRAPTNSYYSLDSDPSPRPQSLKPVLLCTALVNIVGRDKRVHTARILLDSGSMHSFISESFKIRLNAPTIQSNISITGVAQSVTQSNQLCELTIQSKFNDYSKSIKCFVLQRITSSLPTTNINADLLKLPVNINLADPTFHISSEIDLLIGAELFWEILEDNRIRLATGPYLQNSKFGWLLSGPLYTNGFKENNFFQSHCNFSKSLDEQLKRFWEIENVPQLSNVLTHDEQLCEDLFIKTTKRESSGRFSVRIPLRESPALLGDSYNLAKNRFLSLERKLERSPVYKRLYCDFMREYEALGHMSRIHSFDVPNFFLPHHGVLRESTTTKLRVVFNASATTSSGKSLNDIQLPGPALQNDIFSILLRFRQHKYVACADVEKMFRQVLIQPDQRSLQLILWRHKPTDPLSVYQLNTVTYGTASAPYLSMRCIRQLALDCNDDVISRIISEDIFVDDLITGSDNYQTLLDTCEKITNVMQSGCFLLRKWTFNSDVTRSAPTHLFVGEHTQNKTLGIGWHNDSDELYYTTKVDNYSSVSKLNKRVMLSIISQIYDPLGLLAPTVIISKILLQKLWLSKLDWDTPVPSDIADTWNNFIATLNNLNELKIPRHVMSDYIQNKELHIFTDASQNAYGACAYTRTYNIDSPVIVKLLCAKSKVAPLKTISIPRLELCGALVGAKLYKKIINSLRLTFTRVCFWTDSTIVIGWLSMSPHLLKPFVQNRVTEINELTGDTIWFHVSGKQNPADLLSRGLTLNNLNSCELWWNGPSYLQNNQYNFSNNTVPKDLMISENLPELKTCSSNFVCSQPCETSIIQFDKYSSFSKLKRVWAYVLRFLVNIRKEKNGSSIPTRNQQTGSLTVNELNASERLIVQCAQKQSFTDIHECLINNLPIKTNSKDMNRILGLNVFIDENKLIRVGGRLSNSTSLDYNKKHPILLCSKHPLSTLLVREEHTRLLHAGPQLLLSSLRESWWLLNARNLVRKIVRDCIICTRIRGKTLHPLMGNLPAERLDPGFPFIRTGVDYTAPIMILNRRGRGARLVKGYICLFICFLTKAVHLELVTSLSTEDYILALKRFISRRGKPNTIYSDNGKNFVGAAKELSVFLSDNSKQLINFATNEGIKLQFIPPYSPHFGGLWESGIRSCKYHLRRIVGNAKLTFEELCTVLTQIEAVLNSRPISPLSTDPSDLNPLTPGHFLIGRPLTAPPSEDLADARTTRLSRYQHIEQLRQQFWRRWSREYITELQKRTKWKLKEDDITPNSLVLIKEDNLPPLKWRLGRVTRVFPGADGVSRVADIFTATGPIRRASSKICPLLHI